MNDFDCLCLIRNVMCQEKLYAGKTSSLAKINNYSERRHLVSTKQFALSERKVESICNISIYDAMFLELKNGAKHVVSRRKRTGNF